MNMIAKKEFDDFLNNEYESEREFFFFTQDGKSSYIGTKTTNSMSRVDNYMLSKLPMNPRYGKPVWVRPGSDSKTLKGYKAFNRDWTCRHKQYRVGETFEEHIKPIPCILGMHFCLKIVDLFYYYDFDLSKTRIAEVEASDLITTNDGEKFCTNKLRVIREVTPEEVLYSIRETVCSRLYWSEMPYEVVSNICKKLYNQDFEVLAELHRKGIK